MATPAAASHLQKYPAFTELNDLAAEKVGGKILFSSDDWFAAAENLLKSEAPEWREGVFTEFGKWMDGWETRRKRIPGYDWCVIQLGVPGVIRGFDVDTSFFTGNYAPRVSIQAACLDTTYPGRNGRMGTAATDSDFQSIAALNSEKWEYIVPLDLLNPGYQTSCHNFFECRSRKRWTHIRLNIYPDGGVARLHIYGQAAPDWTKVPTNKVVDLVAMEMGGLCIAYSNVHFGHARNLIQPGRAKNMGDGWETARKADRPTVLQEDAQAMLHVPGMDWCVFRLGHPGVVTKIEIDTNHFKGNFPDSCRIEGCLIAESEEQRALAVFGKKPWKTLLPATKLSANKRHFIESGSLESNCGVISHVRLIMAPDGGISRLRLWGHKHQHKTSKL